QVTLRIGEQDVGVEVVDHGGATVAAADEGGGLRGMRERAAVYDGALVSGPRASGGWRTATRLSFTAAAARA
ncbi:MAG: two-component sensor histidine kinase, partial [Conexibacter sp.]|nr:two-component sensor histidine kinase [Conexibacter sp.]